MGWDIVIIVMSFILGATVGYWTAWLLVKWAKFCVDIISRRRER